MTLIQLCLLRLFMHKPFKELTNNNVLFITKEIPVVRLWLTKGKVMVCVYRMYEILELV